MFKSCSSFNGEYKRQFESVKKSKSKKIKLRKMYTQASYKSLRLDNSDVEETPHNYMNPNEASFVDKEESKSRAQGDRSFIINKLCNALDSEDGKSNDFCSENNSKSIQKYKKQTNDSGFLSSSEDDEDIDIDESSSTPTGSEDLLDPKFLSPRVEEESKSAKQKAPSLIQRPQGYGLL